MKKEYPLTRALLSLRCYWCYFLSRKETSNPYSNSQDPNHLSQFIKVNSLFWVMCSKGLFIHTRTELTFLHSRLTLSLFCETLISLLEFDLFCNLFMRDQKILHIWELRHPSVLTSFFGYFFSSVGYKLLCLWTIWKWRTVTICSVYLLPKSVSSCLSSHWFWSSNHSFSFFVFSFCFSSSSYYCEHHYYHSSSNNSNRDSNRDSNNNMAMSVSQMR